MKQILVEKGRGRVGINTYIAFHLKECFISTGFQSLLWVLSVSLEIFLSLESCFKILDFLLTKCLCLQLRREFKLLTISLIEAKTCENPRRREFPR